MLRISGRQMQALDGQLAVRLDQRMVQVIEQVLPELLKDQPAEARRAQLSTWVEQGCERALEMGLEDDADMAVLISLQLVRTTLTPPEQEKLREWAGDLLKRKDSNGRVNLALVESTLGRLAASQPLAQRLQGLAAQVRAAYR